MKRLILHPDDRSTDFLKPIYSQLKNTTVITGGLRRQSEIHELIQSNIFIWCYASDFVTKHKLKGYCSGMFISAELEALYHHVEATEEQIYLSNDIFAAALGEALLHGYSMNETYEYI